MKILVVNNYDGQYSRFWGELGDIISRIPEFMADPESFGLVCFTGGEDVSPELYGHKNFQSHNSMSRDKQELLVFQMAQKHGIPMTGICRGSQFLNVMCGGTMVQHLAKSHGGSPHLCQVLPENGSAFRDFPVTSSHHQMSVLGAGGSLWAWAMELLNPEDLVYDGELPETVYDPLCLAGLTGEKKVLVTEAFAYPDQKIFAVQHHPEWQDTNKEAPQWTLQKIREICLGEKKINATS